MKIIAKKLSGFLVMSLSVLCLQSHAQDSLKLTLPEAEAIFIQKNLTLLAEKYNVDIARAQVIQARLHINPNIQFAGNIYDPERNRWFNMSNKTGEYTVGAQQLILLAGKRNKQIQLAETNVSMAENRLFDLLRTLRYSLRSDFYQLYYLQASISAYEVQIGYLDRLNSAYEQLLARGVVTLKDAVRIKSLLYSLKAEQAALSNQASDLNAELQLLLGSNSVLVAPVVPAGERVLPANFTLSTLLDTALTARQDLQLVRNTVVYNQQNYSLQKALATPDLTLGAQFDKRGSFVDNATFFTMAIDLPFFNRNQGNIRAARTSLQQSQTLVQRQQELIQNEVQRAYVKYLNTDAMLRSFDPAFKSDLDRLLHGVTDNFQKKNISLLEFVDFYESYKANVLQFNQLQNTRRQAQEDLQFAVGKTIFND